MTPESREFLKHLAGQPKGRVGYVAFTWDWAQTMAAESLALGYVKERPLYPRPYGFQITDAGKAYLAGEAL